MTKEEILTKYSDGSYKQFKGYKNILLAMEEYAQQAIADHEEKQHYYACCGEPKGRRHKGWCENSKPYQEGGEG